MTKIHQKLFLVYLFAFLLFGCKGGSSSSATTAARDRIIISFYPDNKSLVFPSDITIYVDLAVKPELGNIIFSVWRGGNNVPGAISVEEVGQKFRVRFTPTERSEGTYIVYFGYGGETTFWTFFVEAEAEPLIFPSNSVPIDGEKNFPIENTIYVSFGYPVNPDTVDEETVKLLMIKPSLEEEVVPARILFFDNSVIISPEIISLSTNYRIEITKVIILPYEDNPGMLSHVAKFRSLDFTPPYIVGCSPDFCIRQCAEVAVLRSLEIRFREDEEIDELSVIDNFALEKDGKKIVFSEIYKVFDAVELVKKNIVSDPVKLFIYRNRIFVDFVSGVSTSGAVIRIYILPRLSDSSGNLINDFFSWCVRVSG